MVVSKKSLTFASSKEKKIMSKWCCKECGSENIQIRMWVNPNTSDIIGDCEDKECWCENCKEHTRFFLKKE